MESHEQRRDAVRPANSSRLPWYDSVWLTKYLAAESVVRRIRPDALPWFVEAFKVFRTRSDFGVKLLERPFDEETLAAIRRTVASLRPADLELHETRHFGRFVVHDHPFFTEFQERTVGLVSDVVGEPVEAAYNFLSLYTASGVCPVHMDSPQAKWTLDLCIDQSAPWPIYFSQVRPWPEPPGEAWGADWDAGIRSLPDHRFTSYSLLPGQAVIFSGSSQWHYRDAMPRVGTNPFCKLLFLHFIPRGTAELVKPKNWARLFGIPELAEIN